MRLRHACESAGNKLPLRTRRPPGLDETLRFYTQCLGHACDVVEVGNHLRGIMNGAVVETVGAQDVQVGRGHVMRMQRELAGKRAQRAVGRAEGCGTPIGHKGVDEDVGIFWGKWVGG